MGIPRKRKNKKENSVEPPGCRRADGRWREEGRYERTGWRERPDDWVFYFNQEGMGIYSSLFYLILFDFRTIRSDAPA